MLVVDKSDAMGTGTGLVLSIFNSRTQLLNVQTETHQDTPAKGKPLTAVMGEEQSYTDPNPGFMRVYEGYRGRSFTDLSPS